MRDYIAKVQYVKVILAQSSFLDHSLHLKLKCDNQRREGVQIIWVSKWLKGCILALGRKCICAESSHLSPAAQAVGGRAEAHRAPPSAVGKVPRPTHHPGQGGDSDHQLEAGQGLQSKVLLLPTASSPPPLYHQSMTRPSLTIFCLTLSL